MKRVLSVVGLTLFLAAPAAAQFIYMPTWNSPKGGTGVTVSGDYGMPDDNDGGGSAFGGRASVGFSRFTVYGGVTSWTPVGGVAFTSFGGGVRVRFIGGCLVPVAVNLIAGGATANDVGSIGNLTNAVAGAGVSASLPIPGFSLEPYINLLSRWSITDADTESGFGATFGANVTMGLFGAHLAWETVTINDEARGTFGIGLHVTLKSPI